MQCTILSNNMIEESKHCSVVMTKHFNNYKELVMTIEELEKFWNFESSAIWWICGNDYVGNDVKVRNHCHITGKLKKNYDSLLKKVWFPTYYAITGQVQS